MLKTSRSGGGGGSGGGSFDHGLFRSSSFGASTRPPSSTRGRFFSRPSSGGKSKKKKQLGKTVTRKTLGGDDDDDAGGGVGSFGAASFDGDYRPSILSPRNVVRDHQQQQYQPQHGHQQHAYNPRQQQQKQQPPPPQKRQQYLPPKPKALIPPAKEDQRNDTHSYNGASPEPMRPRRTVFFPDDDDEDDDEYFSSDDDENEDDDGNTIDFGYENDENEMIENAENNCNSSSPAMEMANNDQPQKMYAAPPPQSQSPIHPPAMAMTYNDQPQKMHAAPPPQSQSQQQSPIHPPPMAMTYNDQPHKMHAAPPPQSQSQQQSPIHPPPQERKTTPPCGEQTLNEPFGNDGDGDLGMHEDRRDHHPQEAHSQERLQVEEESWHASFDDPEPPEQEESPEPLPAVSSNTVSEQSSGRVDDSSTIDDGSLGASTIVSFTSESETLEIVKSQSVESHGSTKAVRTRRSSRHQRLTLAMQRTRRNKNGPQRNKSNGRDEKNASSADALPDLPPIPPSSSSLSVELDEEEAQRILSASVVPFQAIVRGHFARREASVKIGALLTLQRAFRIWLGRVRVEKLQRQDEFRYEAKQSSVGAGVFCAIHIQRIWRGYAIRLKRGRAATEIQSAWRSYSAVQQFYRDLSDVILAQSAIRRWLALRRYADTFNQAQAIRGASATVIQSAWRSFDCSMNYLNAKLDIIIVQSVVRRWRVQEKIKRSKASYATTKRLVRSFLLRSELKRIL